MPTYASPQPVVMSSHSEAPSKPPAPLTFRRREWRSFSIALVTILVTLAYAVLQLASPHPQVVSEPKSQPMWEDILQLFCVMALAFLAFELHNLQSQASRFAWSGKGWGADFEGKLLFGEYTALAVMFGAPAIFFFLAMLHKYQAGVFAMALVAIYVASEHYSNLVQQRGLLDQQDIVVKNLGVHVGRLSVAFGLDEGKSHLYSAYAQSTKRIRGIIRFVDIDHQWWDLEEDEEKKKADRYEYWPRYFESGDPTTLYESLKAAPCDDVLFVCDVSFPFSGVGANIDRAIQFNNFIGMAWQWLVFSQVARERPRCSVQYRAASASSWMYVANDHVYQVVPGERPRDSKVRDMTLSDNAAAQSRLVVWAEAEIERAAEGSCSAEEYLCSTFCWIAHTIVHHGDPLGDNHIDATLEKLGMSEWIAQIYQFVERPPSEQPLRMKCRAILNRFLVEIGSSEHRVVSPMRMQLDSDQQREQDGLAPKGRCVQDVAYELL